MSHDAGIRFGRRFEVQSIVLLLYATARLVVTRLNTVN